MNQLHRLCYVLAVLFAIVVGQANGSEITAFGPKEYVRTKGAPNIYSDTFSAEPGEARLVIQNGLKGEKSNSDNRVTSGVITLNGEVLFNHDDFKHQTYILEIPIFLLAENDLRVELESKPGSYLSIEILQTLPDPVYDLLAADLQVEVSGCPNSVNLGLRLTNQGEDDIPAGANVSFYNGDPGSGGTLIGTSASTQDLQATDSEVIAFAWSNPSVAQAAIYARVDDDGTGAGAYEEENEANNLVFLEADLCQISSGDGSISGHIIDAVNGDLLSGVQMRLHIDDNGMPGAVVAGTESEAGGFFHFTELAAGNYIITVSHQGYIDNQRLVSLGEGVGLTNQDIVLSPVLAENEIRIILTWNESPADLEAHLTMPSEQGCRHHCYYFEKTIPTANLDLDDRDGYGPETITITDRVSGTYRYYVHDFTNRYNNSRLLSLSGATVKVFYGDREPMVFSVPYGYGNVWHVFDLDGDTGEITPIHTLTRQSEPGRIDYPVITSGTPYRYAYWGSTYRYQATATDPDNDKLTFSLENAPAGMTIDPDTGLVEWVPSGDQMGWYYNIRIKVEDGRCGEAALTFNIYVNSQPSINFSVSPCSGFNPGGDITLTWSTTMATTVLIDQGIGEVPTTGTLTIPSPEVPTAYTLTAFNDAALFKRVVPTPPGASFYFSPRYIDIGQSTTLYWDSQCSTNRSISHGIGSVPVSGSQVVTPTQSGYYYLYPSNAGGTATYRAYVGVRYPAEYFDISPRCNMTPGEPMTLSWNINNATNVTISPDIGPVEASGTRIVHPMEPGTYTLTALVDGRSVTRNISFPDLPTIDTRPRYSAAIELGQSVNIDYWSQCADTVAFNQGIGAVPVSGAITVTPESLPQTYTVTATNEAGSRSRSVSIYQVIPQLSVSPERHYMDLGDYVTINWSSRYADTLTIDQGVGEVPHNGSMTIAPESLPRTYTVSATNAAGSTIRRVYLYPIAPTGTLSADPAIMKVGDSTILTWTCSRATSCTITPDIGPVTLNGSMTITPTQPTTYTLAAQNFSGATHHSSVHVGFVYPLADLKASAVTINQGETVKLSWIYANATKSVIDQGIGEVELGEERTVAPSTTTTYTMTATGPGGTASDSVTIKVIPTGQPPIVNLTASPGIILPGGSAVLTWQSSNADSLTIEPGIGPVATTGSVTVTPEKNTTYVATATGPGGTIIDQALVTVVHPSPTLSLSAEPANIQPGDSALLSWTSSNAETVTFDQGIGEVSPEGSMSVTPGTTTLYTATASGPGGTTTRHISINVSYPTPTVTFTASPQAIKQGESTTLTWSTENAESVIIRPNIGSVAASGTMVVTPTEDTTYIIYVTGMAEAITRSLLVDVVAPPPTASLGATQTNIDRGDSSTLSWHTQFADTCSMEPDVGPIGCNGQTEVSPTMDTTYTLTATGDGGITTAQATITVNQPLPIVSLTADPQSVSSGHATVLTWTAQYADSCTLDPDFGAVDCNGQTDVAPDVDTTYIFTATGLGGTSIAETKVQVTSPNPMTLTITSPTEGANFDRNTIQVTGSVHHTAGLETGVLVNGVTALVYNDQFVASHIPLTEGANTLTVRAVDANGVQLEESVYVTATPSTRAVELSLDVETGVAPLATTLNYDTNFTPTTSPSITYMGPAALDFTAGTEPGTWEAGATEPGIYTFFIEAVDDQGITHSDEVSLLVMDKSAFDAMIHAKWNKMKAAMGAGDIEAAVREFTYGQRDLFREIFTVQNAKLAQIAAEMQEIQFIHQKNNTAEYRIRRDLVFQGSPETVTFYIYFDREIDGIWRIRDF